MRLLLLARHGQSLLNVDRVVNGDPARDPGLSPLGLEQGERLARQIAGARIDVGVVSEFPRAQQTIELALRGRAVPLEVDAELNDVRIGELDLRPLADYRAWKHAHVRSDRFPGGESLDEAARRYATAFERILSRAEDTILCVCHEFPVRYLVNAAGGSDDLDRPLHEVPNATPYAFDAAGLRRGVEQLRSLVSPPA